MKVVDARSGLEVKIGQTVHYKGDPKADWTLLSFEDNFTYAKARVKCQGKIWNTPMPVHFFSRHGWRVAIFPS